MLHIWPHCKKAHICIYVYVVVLNDYMMCWLSLNITAVRFFPLLMKHIKLRNMFLMKMQCTAPKCNVLHQNSHGTLAHKHKKFFFAAIFSVLSFLYSVMWYSRQFCLDRHFVCPPLVIPFCHVLSYTLCFSVIFWCDFLVVSCFCGSCCILSVRLIVFYVETALPLHFGFGLLVHGGIWKCLCILITYYYINLLTPWLLGLWLKLFTAFPVLHCYTLNHGMSQHTPTHHTHTCVVVCSLCGVRIEFLLALRIMEVPGQL